MSVCSVSCWTKSISTIRVERFTEKPFDVKRLHFVWWHSIIFLLWKCIILGLQLKKKHSSLVNSRTKKNRNINFLFLYRNVCLLLTTSKRVYERVLWLTSKSIWPGENQTHLSSRSKVIWCAVTVNPPGYFKQRSHWMKVRERRVSISQLDGGDAQRPNVTASVVGWVQLLLTGDDLRREINRGSKFPQTSAANVTVVTFKPTTTKSHLQKTGTRIWNQFYSNQWPFE